MTEGARETEAPTDEGDEKWLFSQNLAVYAGQWVAVFGHRILAHGSDLHLVHREATRKASPGRPLFYSVPVGISGGA